MVMKTGIYRILNLLNGKYYIGSAINIKGRFREHKSSLKLNKHENGHLQNSWNKYGKKNFKFEVLLYCDIDNLLFYEQRALDVFQSYKDTNGYNICMIAGSTLGTIRSDISKEKMRKAAKKRMENPEIFEKIKPTCFKPGGIPWNKGKKDCQVAWNKGLKGAQEAWNKGLTKETDERVNNYAKSLEGKYVSDETKEKLRVANLGKSPSEEAKENMSQAQKKSWANNEERKQKLLQRLEENHHFKGKNHTEESKQKMREAKLGKVTSEETKEKQRQASLKQWEARKK